MSKLYSAAATAIVLAIAGCEALNQPLSTIAKAESDLQPVEIGNGTMTRAQFAHLNTLAPGQSRGAMNSWAKGNYPHAVNGTTELWRLEDNPGFFIRMDFKDGRYQGYKFQPQ